MRDHRSGKLRDLHPVLFVPPFPDEFVTVSSDAVNNSQQLMSEPGSVARMIKQYYGGNTTRRDDVPAAWYDRFQETGCAMIPRVLFTAVESSDEEVTRDVPSVVNASHLETMRWRYRATRRHDGISRAIDDWGKSLMDVSVVQERDFEGGGTAHFALHSRCNREHRMTNYSQVPIGMSTAR